MISATDSSDSDTITAAALSWQMPVAAQLVKLKQQHQLPHAILIQLETSIDSRAFGWFVVQSLLCLHPQDNGLPCNECQHCQLMQSNSYPDLTFTTLLENERTHKPNRDIKIEQIRKLIHRLSLTSSLQGGKFALVYPAERMNASSANSLLKTLEEPSADAILVLLTHNAGRLPITIRSRCQQWQIARPTQQEATQWLTENGMPAEQTEDYLQLAQMDAQKALQLSARDSRQHLQDFQASLKAYLTDQCSVLSVVNGMKNIAEDELQMILQHVLVSLLHKQLEKNLETLAKRRIIELLDLIKHAAFVLQSSENNLILQLQLEDVLISLKQLLNREKLHARTSQPGNSVP